MLTNLFVSNYVFVDDKGLELQLDRINVILGFSSLKETLFIAPCILDGIMSNLLIRYSSQKFFGSFDELVYDGTISKPTVLYLRFKDFNRPLHESFYSLFFSASPVLFDRYSEEFKNIDVLELYLEIMGERAVSLRLSINEHITFSITKHETWSWKAEIDNRVIIEKNNVFPAVNFNALLLSIRNTIQYFDIRSWLIERYQSMSTDSQSSIIARKLIDLLSDLDNAKRIGEFLRNSCGINVRLKYIPPSSLGIEYRISNSWKKTNFYDLDLIVLIPALATLLGSSRGDTIILSELSILAPKIQRALFRLAADLALEEDKQVIFLTNSPIIVRELLTSDENLRRISKLWLVYHENTKARATQLRFDENGIYMGEFRDKFDQFWTKNIAEELAAD